MITQIEQQEEYQEDKQARKQNLTNFKFELMQNISPKEFYDLKKEFELNQDKGGVGINEFVAIFSYCLFQISTEPQDQLKYENLNISKEKIVQKYLKQYEMEINALIEIYIMMDKENKNSVTWEQITDFIIEMQEIINRDESLYEIKLSQFKLNKELIHNPIEKIYNFGKFKYFGMLENNQKSLRLYNPTTFQEAEEIKIGKTAIASCTYLQDKNIMVLSANDKYINFYHLQEKYFFRRFRLPEVQTFLVYSKEKNTLYTAQHSTKIIYGWDLEKIFDPEFEELMYQIDAYKDTEYKIQKDYVIVDTKREISYLLNIDSQNLLVVGTTDGIIRLYQNQLFLENKNIKLKGHTKSIKCIDYNEELRYLVTCSFDYDIYVWNTYLQQHLKKLPGNNAPHISVICPKNEKYLMLSCDTIGTVKLWDLANFACLQIIQIDNICQQIKSAIYLENQNKLICCSKSFHIYEFDKSYSPKLSDDKNITAICISEQNLELYSSSGQDIRCWDLIKGKIIRVFKNITKGDISQLSLIQNIEETKHFFEIKKTLKNERMVVVGSTLGEILCLDILTGFIMKKLELHKKELVLLQHTSQFDLIITAGQDRTIKIFNNKEQQDEKLENYIQEPMRVIQNTFKSEITAGCLSENLQLIATVGRDSDIRFWEMEKGQFNQKIDISYGYATICHMQFLDPLPLLVTSDIQGFIQVWLTPPHEQSCQLLLKWKNLFTISRFSQVTCIKYTYDKSKNYLELILGDETGYVRLLDISLVIQEFQIQPITNKKENRNMYRNNIYDYSNYQITEQKNKFQQKQSLQEQQFKLLPEKSAKQILQWQAHKHSNQDVQIIDIIILNCTQKKNYVTLGSDKKIQLFDNKGNLIGILKQSETNLPKQNYLDQQNNNSDQQSQHWKLVPNKNNQTYLQKQIQLVKSNFQKLLEKRENIRKLNHLHFAVESFEEMEISGLSRVNSQDIAKSLQEVDTYLYGKKPY